MVTVAVMAEVKMELGGLCFFSILVLGTIAHNNFRHVQGVKLLTTVHF